jgi:hypothetical protein
MAKITTAWVYVPTKNIRSKQMTFDEVRAFCKENGLGVWENGKFIEMDDYTLGPVEKPIMTYCFCTGSYETSPSITLVPRGTTVEFGMFKFPEKS